MAWSNIKTKGKKPLRWWYHKLLCELGYFIYCKFSFLKIGSWGYSIYYTHLNKMCDKYKINIYGEPINRWISYQWSSDDGSNNDIHIGI